MSTSMWVQHLQYGDNQLYCAINCYCILLPRRMVSRNFRWILSQCFIWLCMYVSGHPNFIFLCYRKKLIGLDDLLKDYETEQKRRNEKKSKGDKIKPAYDAEDEVDDATEAQLSECVDKCQKEAGAVSLYSFELLCRINQFHITSNVFFNR